MESNVPGIPPRLSKHTDDISVVVPCIPRDKPHLDTLIWTINNQTVLPNEIVIAISETSDAEAKALLRELVPLTYIPLIVVGSKDKLSAGINRNRGVEASSCSRISFFDADDQMHPDRIRLIQEAFDVYNARCVIHDFTVGKFKSQFSAKLALRGHLVMTGDEVYTMVRNTDLDARAVGVEWYTDPLVPEDALQVNTWPLAANQVIQAGSLEIGIAGTPDEILKRYVAGNPSCTRQTMQEVGYGDTMLGEDNMFLRSILRRYGPLQSTLVYVGLPLTMYYPSASPTNEWAREEWAHNTLNEDFEDYKPAANPTTAQTKWSASMAPADATTSPAAQLPKKSKTSSLLNVQVEPNIHPSQASAMPRLRMDGESLHYMI